MHLAAGRFLREIADARRRRRLDPATIGLECPCDNFQQRGFAGAVATDQPDAGFRRQRCGGAIENEVAAEPKRDAVKREHGTKLTAWLIPVRPQPRRMPPSVPRLMALSSTRVAIGTPERMIDLPSVVQKPSLREAPLLFFLVDVSSP